MHFIWRSVSKIWGFPGGSVVRNLLANAGDLGLIPTLGKSLRGGNGNPLHYPRLENLMDRGSWKATAHRVTKDSDTAEHSHTQTAVQKT